MTAAQKLPRTHQSHVFPVAGALPIYESRRVDVLDDLELVSGQVNHILSLPRHSAPPLFSGT